MTETEALRDRMRGTLDAEIDAWLAEGSVRLWEDEVFFDGDYLQKHVLAVDPEEGSVTVIRSWMSGPQAVPAVSVDLQMPYERFAGDIDDETFPHGRHHAVSPLETPFRAHLLGEHAEIVWQSSGDPAHAAFIARTAKVGRDEQVVAGTVSVKNGDATVTIGLRQQIAALQPAPRRSMAR